MISNSGPRGHAVIVMRRGVPTADSSRTSVAILDDPGVQRHLQHTASCARLWTMDLVNLKDVLTVAVVVPLGWLASQYRFSL